MSQAATMRSASHGEEITVHRSDRILRITRILKKWVPPTFLVCLQACGVDGFSTVHQLRWSETVEIASGEAVEVTRQLTFGVSRPMGEKVGMVIPDSTTLTIGAAGSQVPTIDVGPLVPTLLVRDEETKELIVIAGTNNCRFWQRNAEPDPPYWAFRLRGAEWFRVDLPPSLIGRQSNLLVDIRPDDRGELKRADVEQRKASQSTADSLSKSLRNVLARDPAKLNCGHAKGADGELDLKSFRRL